MKTCPSLNARKIRPAILFLIVAAGFLAQPGGMAASEKTLTALDRYVAAPDPNYRYELISSTKGQGHTTHVLEMVSQQWLTTNEVNQPLWKHWMVIIRPDKVRTSKAFLMIGGGSNDRPAPKSPSAEMVQIAIQTQSVLAELRMVPNQPLTFADEEQGRYEDSLIAYTWDKFLRTGDEKWPARLPMTKSAVRAMDTVTSFCASDAGGRLKIDSFVVGGGSKRGWTTWTTAAVDKRVTAIFPLVIDLLNVEPSFRHHYRAYGFWAPAIRDYERMNIMEWEGGPEYRKLMEIEDPYEYRQRFTMPKFIINSTGDQFFLPDSAQFYFQELPEPKYLRYVPNTDHSLRNSDAWMTILACYDAVITGATLPRFQWSVPDPGTIRVKNLGMKPTGVKLWEATNPEARDFRLETIGPSWLGTPLSESEPGVYVGQPERPEKGWTAFFVELTFPSKSAAPFVFTSEVRVVPDTLPHAYPPPKKQAN
jgi:PhoPQ-activated pathogenicity-related protein